MDYHGEHQRPEDLLSDDEITMIRDTFMFFDKDGDGTMPADEVAQSLRAVGTLATDREISEELLRVDPDNAGRIDFSDFLSLVAHFWVRNKDLDHVDEVRSVFSVFDKEENGLLNMGEMKHVLARLGDVMKPEEVDAFLQKADKNGDGFIRMDDLVRMFSGQTESGSLLGKTID